MSSSITLTSSISQNLYSLQNTSKLMEETEYRLATGKKVNSALDDPVSYFAAASHTQASSDLEVLKDSMNEGIQTIQAASDGIDAILDLIDSAISTAKSARSGESSTEVTSYMNDYDDILQQIDDLADDSGYSGINLLKEDVLTVTFDAAGSSTITVTGEDCTSTGLSLSDAADWWNTTDSEPATATIDTYITALQDARSTLRANAESLSNKLSTINTRLDFTTSMMETLDDGAANLVNADTNEESANLLTLQTQQELALNSLSIASDAQSAVLNLF